MNKKTLLAFGLSAAISFGSTATAADNPWHIGLSINQANLSDISTSSTSQVANVTRNINIDTDDQTGFGITIGRTIFSNNNGNKLIAELSYANNDHDLENLQFMNNNFAASEGRSEGSVEVETISARLTYKFELGKIAPYVGLGIGQSDLEVDVRYGMSVGTASTSRPPFATGGDSATAVEFRIGAEYQLSDSLDLFLEYSAVTVDDIEFSRTGGGPGGLATTTQSGDFDVNSVNLGLKFNF
ncbi:MAG: porin family protein [Arenicella sp.]|nr:porin family protein [Arenicella sp.]